MTSRGDLLTTGQAARLLGCSRQHVVDLCRTDVLPYASVRTHRRVRRADVDVLLSGGSSTRDQERSLWLHRAVAGRLTVDTDKVLDVAERNLRRLDKIHPSGMTARWLARWRDVLDSGPESVFEALTSRAGWAVELRQNSPFAGVLSDPERKMALESFQAYWREA